MAIALRYAARTDLGLGPKSRNEDSGYAGPHLLVLADGMGGHAAGDGASSMIVGQLAPLDGESIGADHALRTLERSIHEANSRLSRAMKDSPELTGMGSTTIAMLRTGNKLAMAHIGDSRAYLLRNGTFSLITQDHSFVQQLVDEQRITSEEAEDHPQRSLVTRVMTGQEDDEPDLSIRELKVGDRYLLCSDGLSDFVRSDIIQEILSEAKSPDEAAERCIEVALKASTRDNVTVVVAEVVDLSTSEAPPTVPQIVGAAAVREPIGKRTRALPVSPAAKAAALSREASGRTDDEDDEPVALAEEGPSGRRRWGRRVLVAAVVTLLLGGGGAAAWTWAQTQYFIGAESGYVAVYRGVAQDAGPFRLSQVESVSDIPLTDLPTHLQDMVSARVPVDDLASAQGRVALLRQAATECRAQAAGGVPCGSVPVPSPTGSPTDTVSSTVTTAAGTPTVPGASSPTAPSTKITTARTP
ncbi:MAG: protein phosphatase 2C domain-containing protein [Actinomycetota bacterium]|nr:protein phosphatase 2C domain-containing protein [Actinomycetota bacterium]